MGFLLHLPLRKKLLLLLLPPVSGLLLFAVVSLVEKNSLRQSAVDLQEVVSFSLAINGYVHDSQIERGRSAAFLSSGAKVQHEQLLRQRQVSDAKRKTLESTITNLTMERYGAGFKQQLQVFQTQVAEMQEIRTGIDGQTLSANEAINFYSKMHKQALMLVGEISGASPNVDIAVRLQAASMFALDKEQVGKVRALVSGALAQDEFDDEGRDKLHLVLNAADIYRQQFLLRASDEIRQLFHGKMAQTCVIEAHQMQDVVLGKQLTGHFGVSPEAWFDQMTCKIDLLKDVEDQMGVSLLAELAAMQSSARNSFLSFLLLALLMVLGSGWFVYVLVRLITRQTDSLIENMQAFSEGEMDRTIEITSTDEIGQIASSFNTMAGKIREAAEREQEIFERDRQATVMLKNKVAQLRGFVEKIATGDLTDRTEVEGDDDLAGLGQNMNNMTDNLSTMADQIIRASSQLGSTLHQMQESISTQSAGATEQAASVSETVSTLEEIRATSRQTMEKATDMGTVAEQTRLSGEQGLEALEHSIAGMQLINEKMDIIAKTILELSEQSQRISEITASVNNIAVQSKMLSLNASIEAAKAGEAGKGFAVVASEVRGLAEQSQQATAQIDKILASLRQATEKAVMVTEEGQKGVDQGVELVAETGERLKQVVDMVRDTAVSSTQIVAAVRQETSGIDQIATAMGDINKATSQFAASAAQSKQVVEDLNRLATELRDCAAAYKI
jgi:methyl-accepting chemotaxis protein